MVRLLNIETTEIPDLLVLELKRLEDDRGVFSRLFCNDLMNGVLGGRCIRQINHSLTLDRGCVRGFHFQKPPHAEMKLIRCLKGAVWDVAVDIRRHSPTYLKWFGSTLNPSNNKMMVIPEGFAHGFQTLEANTELLYLHTELYEPEAEGGLRFDDPTLGVKWPLPVTQISQRDQSQPNVGNDFHGVRL